MLFMFVIFDKYFFEIRRCLVFAINPVPEAPRCCEIGGELCDVVFQGINVIIAQNLVNVFQFMQSSRHFPFFQIMFFYTYNESAQFLCVYSM